MNFLQNMYETINNNEDLMVRVICPHCGKEFHIYGDRRRKYCSHECYIADRFKGGDGDE